MSPQPLSTVKPNCTFDFNPDALAKHPTLSPIVAETISLGAHTEYEWSAVLVHLLRTDPKTGMTLYESVTSADARRAMLLNVAEMTLPKAEFLLVKSVMKAVTPARRVRNNFAHHIWGHSPGLPNALLLIDPAELASWEVALALVNKEMSEGGKVIMPPEVNMRSVMVWTERDLKDARKAVETALETISLVRFGLDMSAPGVGVGDPTRRLLLSRPHVLQAAKTLYRANGLRAPRAPRGKTPSKKRK